MSDTIPWLPTDNGTDWPAGEMMIAGRETASHPIEKYPARGLAQIKRQIGDLSGATLDPITNHSMILQSWLESLATAIDGSRTDLLLDDWDWVHQDSTNLITAARLSELRRALPRTGQRIEKRRLYRFTEDGWFPPTSSDEMGVLTGGVLEAFAADTLIGYTPPDTYTWNNGGGLSREIWKITIPELRDQLATIVLWFIFFDLGHSFYGSEYAHAVKFRLLNKSGLPSTDMAAWEDSDCATLWSLIDSGTDVWSLGPSDLVEIATDTYRPNRGMILDDTSPVFVGVLLADESRPPHTPKYPGPEVFKPREFRLDVTGTGADGEANTVRWSCPPQAIA